MSQGGGQNLLIKWYCDAERGRYYFFVPEALDNDGLCWLFPQDYKVVLEDREIGSGEPCSADEGIYTVCAGHSEDDMQTYTVEFRRSSPIASLFFETDSRSLAYLHEAKENRESGSYTLLDGEGRYCGSGAIADIHCRGNASWEETDKKSYQIKLEKKASLLGMGEAKHWLLLANAFDDTLLRNVTAFEMAEELSLPYTPQARFVDVYANGEYIGNYILTEKIEIAENRINIRDLEKETELLNPDTPLSEAEFFMEEPGRLYSTKGYRIANVPDDISGGYLLEIEMSDRYGLEASGFLTSRMQAVVIKSPVYASHEQVSYIAERYQDFEDALFSEDGYSPYTGAYFGDYIDMNSFAGKYLLEEVVKNLDASFTSQFFYKPDRSVSDKFFAGPAWDYDKAIAASGITNEGIDLHDPSGLYVAVKKKDSDIWYGLYCREEFRETALSIYFEEFEPKARELAESWIDTCAASIERSALNNALRWNVFGEAEDAEEKALLYREQKEELKAFINDRLDYLNQEWGGNGS